jgi:hypothetical protein
MNQRRRSQACLNLGQEVEDRLPVQRDVAALGGSQHHVANNTKKVPRLGQPSLPVVACQNSGQKGSAPPPKPRLRDRILERIPLVNRPLDSYYAADLEILVNARRAKSTAVHAR